LFLPVSELNHLRQQAVEQLLLRRDWAREARLAERRARVEEAVNAVPHPVVILSEAKDLLFRLSAQVFRIEDADAAIAGGATEICFDPFLRHPAPPVARIRALQERAAAAGVGLRLRTPTIVRPEDRKAIDKWLAL